MFYMLLIFSTVVDIAILILKSHTHTHTHMLGLLTHVLYRLWEMYTTRLPWSDCNLEQMTTRVVVQVSVYLYTYIAVTLFLL